MVYANTSTLALQAMEEERLGLDEYCDCANADTLGYCAVCGMEIPDTVCNFVHDLEGNLVCEDCFDELEKEADEYDI